MKQLEEINIKIQDLISHQQKINNLQKPFKFLLLAYLVKQGLQNLDSIEFVLSHLKTGFKTLFMHQNTHKLAVEAMKVVFFYIALKYGSKIAKKYMRQMQFAQLRKEAELFRKQAYKKLTDLELPEYGEELVKKVQESDVQQLMAMLDAKEVTSVQILNIFTKQCQKLGIKLEFITQQNYEQALKLAQNCDENRFNLTEEQKLNQPLYGIPVSIKESFVVEGMVSTIGQIQNLNNVGTQHGRIVQLLISGGAIPFVKTNVPQMLVNIESSNLIFGNAKNPWNSARTAGGSSGGESGIIAARGSPFGLGTDIGSSIRQPAAYCGLAGLKPSSSRVSLVGHNAQRAKELMLMQCCLKSAAGPIGKTTQDCALMMEALLNKENFDNLDEKKYPKDFFYTPLPFNKQEFQKKDQKLKIGYFKSMDIFPSCPAHQRAVQESVDVLRKLGHECVEVEIPNINEIINLFILSVGTDALYQINKVRKDEPLTKDFLLFENHTKNRKQALKDDAKNTKKIAVFDDLLNFIKKNENMMIWDAPVNITSSQYKLLSFEVQKAKNQFSYWFNQNKFDAILSPVTAYPSLKLGTSYVLINSILYCAIYNILDLPAGTIPVTVVQENEQKMNQDLIKQKSQLNMINLNMNGISGLPVGVQIAGLQNTEEKILNIMQTIEKEVQFHQKYQPNLKIL